MEYINNSFQGKKVFITGGSRGIGKEISDAFQKCGAEVIAPTRAQLDLADADSVKQYLQQNNHNDVDVFVFCAGVNPKNELKNLKLEDLTLTFQVNLFSSIQLVKEYAEGMKKRGNGKIIFITSLYSCVTREGRIPYTSSKHAIAGCMKTLALELAPYNICVDAVAPGYVMTEMTKQNLSEAEICEIQKCIPTGRFQTVREIADTVLFLASDMNQSITGQTIYVDGGFLCK